MRSVADLTMTAHLQGLSQQKTAPIQQMSDKFGNMLKTSIAEVNQAQISANRAAEQIAAGETKNLHGTMIKLEEADISLRLMVQVRNKAVEAYQEIMRMQV